MIPVATFSDLTVAVMGLGRSGLAAARALTAGGARVLAWDDDPATRAAAEKGGVPVNDLTTGDFAEIAVLVLSPGIPDRYPTPHPIAARARRAGCEIVCDIDLLGRSAPEARFLGITGTNGKSTVTALVGHIFAAAGLGAATGGNLGIPVLALEPLDATGWYVLEMSSYQLERTRSIAFEIAVLLNISPDHLDRHGGMDGYIAAKRAIFRHQAAGATAVVGVDDEDSRAIHDALVAAGSARVVPISAERAVAGGVYVLDGDLHDDSAGDDQVVASLDGIATLPGHHNWQNIAAAYAAARAAGLAPQTIAAALAGYPGLPHRQARVAEIDGVVYVDDSKATNVAAAARALACYDRILWIAGGRAKSEDLSALAPWFAHIAHAFLIGEAADGFARALDGHVPWTKSETLARAVAQADALAHEAEAGAVVLLSPACASFDQFSDFEARGRAFATLVASLPRRQDATARATGGRGAR